MFKHYFERIEHIEVWPIISLIIFVVFFVTLIARTVLIDRKHVNEMSNLPLHDDAKAKNENHDHQ